MKKDLNYYMGLRYALIIEPYFDRKELYYVGHVPELEGCITDGATKEEVLSNIREAMHLWIECNLDAGRPIPEPTHQSLNSHVTFRLPKTLHKKLMREADKQGVSINKLVAEKLSR